RLLSPGAAAQLDAELFNAFCDRRRIRNRPRHEESSELALEQWGPRRRQTCPLLEVSFDPRPQHAMNPCQRIWRGCIDDRAWRRIGPCVVELSPHREIGKRGTIAEQIGSLRKVRLENRESVAERVLDLRRGNRIRSDER